MRRDDSAPCVVALSACDCVFSVTSRDDETSVLVRTAFSGLARDASASRATVRFHIDRDHATDAFWLRDSDGRSEAAEDADTLLFQLDKALTLALQRARPDLYFLHAAVVAKDGWVGVLAAPPGTGKSTLTLALLERGFVYLSDELAPVDLRTMRVEPFPHALCLKGEPPAPLRLPAAALRIGTRVHVPAEATPGGIATNAAAISAFVFLHRRAAGAGSGTAERLTGAAGVAHLMANALNALAHPADGMVAAATLSRRVPCFLLNTGDLNGACAEIESMAAAASE